MVAHISEYTKNHWLYTLNECIVWYMSCISIKLFKQKKAGVAILTSIKIPSNQDIKYVKQTQN